ncbi:hypothetical protein P3X46_014942 [Hevea brasiliensis]|uniref:Uncharacterized protein n=1 Tax=Hevea brasiliensis TaxID=3981 RepID=A0ABQ9LUB3_HEVBR|nr:hypothetical protein P3X46_014942 [Hevea brasiliensis]
MTDGEGRVSGTVGGGRGPSYWLDACEDILTILIHQLFKIQLVILHIRINIGNDFFGGIDHILDSIKNCTSAIVGNGIREGKESSDKGLDCNGKAEKKSKETKEKLPEEQARQYQSDGLQQAKKRNTIAFLETGAGKTLIAILLIKSICNDLQRQNKKMLAVFLVPKAPLVYQNTEVIPKHTGYQVGHYCGEMGQDFWDARRWQREFESKQVLAMTALILLNILRHGIMKMEAINLLILDECHHAVKKHLYALVMSEFYHTRPKEKKTICFWNDCFSCVSSQVYCAIKIHNLESKLDSIVCIIKEHKELEKHVPMPAEIVVVLRRSKWQFMGARDAGAMEDLRQVYGVSESTESDGAGNLIQKVAQSFLMALQNDERANYQLDVKFQESFLEKVVSLLQCQLTEGAVTDKDTKFTDNDNGSLIKILLKYGQTQDFRAIIFVERVVSALVLPKVFAELPSLSFIRCASVIGHNNSREMWTSRMQDTIAKFRDVRKLHEMGEFTDMLLPDKGSGEEREKVDQNDEGEPLPGTARHREFYPEGVANILLGEWILRGSDGCNNSELLHLYMYAVIYVNKGTSKDPFLTQFSDFAVLFGNELDVEVLSMSMDLLIARTIITKASLVFRGAIDITETQLAYLKSFHVRLMSIVLDVDVEPSTTPWDPAKAYLFVPMVGDKFVDPIKEIDWDLVDKIIRTDAWSNPLQRARPDVYLGTNGKTLGGDRREYGFVKLRHGMAFGQKSHPTYGIRGAVAQFDFVKASGFPTWDGTEMEKVELPKGKLMMADTCFEAEDLVGIIVTAAHSGKRFYVDSICYDMTAESSFPRKEVYLGPLQYSTYADYCKQKYGVELIFKQQPLTRGRGVSYCKNLLSPRFEHSESKVNLKKFLTKHTYVFLPPALCLVHPLPGSLVRGAQRLFCYVRAELLGDAYLKWVVTQFLFLKYPQKHEGQLTRMRQQMVSNMILYQYALNKGLQSYIQADRFAPSRWAAPGVLPVFDEDTKDGDCTFFYQERSSAEDTPGLDHDGELESDSSSYRVLSSKTLADVVEALIGVYYVESGENAANHLMKWIRIQVEVDHGEIDSVIKPSNVPESIVKIVDFDALKGALNIKFSDQGLLVEAITHASQPSSRVSCYQRLEFVAAAVNNENFACIAVKHKLHMHLRHGSRALEKQIRDFVKEVQDGLSQPGFNSFCWEIAKLRKFLVTLLNQMQVLFCGTMDEILQLFGRELQELCQQQAEGLEYKASRSGNLASVEVFIDGIQVGFAQNPQKKMAQKLAARNALAVLKEKETAEAKDKGDENGKKKKNGNQKFARQILNDICLRRNWPMPFYRCVNEGGPAHAKRFTFAVRLNAADRGWTDECVGESMPSFKKAKDSAAVLLLEILNKWYP